MKAIFIQLTTVMMGQDMEIKVVDLVMEEEDMVVTIKGKFLVEVTMMVVGTYNDFANYRGQQGHKCWPTAAAGSFQECVMLEVSFII